MKKIILLYLQWACVIAGTAQTSPEQPLPYDPHDLFVSTFYPQAGNAFRSAKGVPGPLYWQNSASYLIHASLSEKDTSVTGDVTISYINNSPDQLDYLWLQLDQNIFKPSSRSVAATRYPGDYFPVVEREYDTAVAVAEAVVVWAELTLQRLRS